MTHLESLSDMLADTDFEGPHGGLAAEYLTKAPVLSIALPGMQLQPGGTPVVIGMSSLVLLRGVESLIEEMAFAHLAGAATTFDRLLEVCGKLKEGIVMLDQSISRRRVLDVLEDLKRTAPKMRVVLMADVHFPHVMRSAVQAGVCGLICKEADPGELRAALMAAAAGRRYVAPEIGADLAEAMMGRDLTHREMEVLGLLSQGECNKVIARTLDVTVGTVKTHVRAIMSKLESRSRTEAVHRAYQLGLVCVAA